MPGSHHGDLFGASAAFSSTTSASAPPSPPSSRRKSLWKKSHSPPPRSASPLVSSSSSSRHRRKENGFLGALFPKRRSSAATHQTATPTHQTQTQTQTQAPVTLRRGRSAAPTPEAIARGVAILRSIFPKWDAEPLQVLLEFNGYIMEEAISAVLKMEADEADAAREKKEAASGALDLSFPIKNPLPDDFLRVREREGGGSGGVCGWRWGIY